MFFEVVLKKLKRLLTPKRKDKITVNDYLTYYHSKHKIDFALRVRDVDRFGNAYCYMHLANEPSQTIDFIITTKDKVIEFYVDGSK